MAVKETTCESYYGVIGDFHDSRSMGIGVCPKCGEEDDLINLTTDELVKEWQELHQENEYLESYIRFHGISNVKNKGGEK